MKRTRVAARVDFPDPEGPVIPRCSPGRRTRWSSASAGTVGPSQLGTVHHDAVAVGQGQGSGGVADGRGGDGEPVEALAGRTCAHRQGAGVGQPADGIGQGERHEQQQGQAGGGGGCWVDEGGHGDHAQSGCCAGQGRTRCDGAGGSSYGPGEPCRLLANGVEGPVRRAPLLELAQPVRQLLDPGPEQRAVRDDERFGGGGAAAGEHERECPEPATSSTTAPATGATRAVSSGGAHADEGRGDERLAHPQPVVEQGVDVVDDTGEQVAAARAEATGDQRDEVGEDLARRSASSRRTTSWLSTRSAWRSTGRASPKRRTPTIATIR